MNCIKLSFILSVSGERDYLARFVLPAINDDEKVRDRNIKVEQS